MPPFPEEMAAALTAPCPDGITLAAATVRARSCLKP